MKRALYPVVKHGSRFALAWIVLPAAIFLPAGLIAKVDWLAITWPWLSAEPRVIVMCYLMSALLTALLYTRGGLAFTPRLTLSPAPLASKLRTDASAPLLAADDQVGGTGAG